MSDEAVLRQQLEFLEMQLQDSKRKEQDLQRMYDGLLDTLGADIDEVSSMQSKAVKDLKDSQAQLERDHEAVIERLTAQILSYEKQVRSLKEQLQDTDYKLRTQKLGFEESLMEVRQEALKAKTEKQQLENKLRQQENGAVQTREQLNKSQQLKLDSATKEIEKIKEDCEREVQEVRAQTDAALAELRQIYEKEKASVEQQLRKALSINSLMRQELLKEMEDKIEEAKADLAKQNDKLKAEKHEADMKAKKYEDELHRAIAKLRISRNSTELAGKCPRTPLDKTRLMSETMSSGPEEVKRLRCQLTTCRSIIASLENNDKRSKETLKQTQEEVERLQRAIRCKANEDPDKSLSSSKHYERLSALLIQKDIEIGSLKRQIGELKGVMNLKSAMKPPTYSPRGHSRSSSAHRDFSELSPMFTLGCPITPDKTDKPAEDSDLDFGSLEEIQETDSMTATYRRALDYSESRGTQCTQQSTLLREQASVDWSRAVKEMEQKTREMALTIKELQIERDRAKLDAEKLLIHLKNFKLEWAVEAERYGEREMELKNQLRAMRPSVPPQETIRVVFKHGRSQSLQCSPR